jgi:histone deacetylase 6
MNTTSVTSTMLESSEMDVLMSNVEDERSDSSNLQNGFIDPRNLNQMEDIDVPDSLEPISQDESQSTSDTAKTEGKGSRALLPTGCCYDDRMKLHANADFSSNPHHPEDPRRIEAIMLAFAEADLIVALEEFHKG